MIKFPMLTGIIFIILCCLYHAHSMYPSAEQMTHVKQVYKVHPDPQPLYHKRKFSLYYRKKHNAL